MFLFYFLYFGVKNTSIHLYREKGNKQPTPTPSSELSEMNGLMWITLFLAQSSK